MTADGTGDDTGGADGGGTFSPGGGSEPEPSDSLRTFGAVVQALRDHVGLSREEFGALVGLSKHTVASIEVGRRMPDPDFVERAEPVLGATGALRKAVRHISRQPGLAAWFRRWARMEAAAITLYTYECRLIPGLLQTEAYARKIFDDQLPPMSDEQIEAQWAARAERQRLLSERPNSAFSFILDEHLFLRKSGGVAVTQELIDHVLSVAAQRNVQIQVLPLATGVHPGLGGPIVLQETPENRWFAYSEGQRGGMLISDSKEISVLQMRYAKLRSQALTSEESTGLLERLRGDI